MSWNRENCTNYTSNGTKQDLIKMSWAEKIHQFQQYYATGVTFLEKLV